MFLCNCYFYYALGCYANVENAISTNDLSIRMSIGTTVAVNFVWCICALCVNHLFLVDLTNLLDSEVMVVEVMSMHRSCCTFAYYHISD